MIKYEEKYEQHFEKLKKTRQHTSKSGGRGVRQESYDLDHKMYLKKSKDR